MRNKNGHMIGIKGVLNMRRRIKINTRWLLDIMIIISYKLKGVIDMYEMYSYFANKQFETTK